MLPLPGPRCFPLSCPGELSLCSHTSQVLPSDPRASHSRSFQGCHLSGRGLPCVLGSRKGLWEKMVRSPRCVLCPGFRPEGHLGLVCAGSVQEAASLCPLSPAWSLQEVALPVPCSARALHCPCPGERGLPTCCSFLDQALGSKGVEGGPAVCPGSDHVVPLCPVPAPSSAPRGQCRPLPVCRSGRLQGSMKRARP